MDRYLDTLLEPSIRLVSRSIKALLASAGHRPGSTSSWRPSGDAQLPLLRRLSASSG